MIWVALVGTGFVTVESISYFRHKQWRELAIHSGLVLLALAMAAMVQWHLWLEFDPLAPIKAVFMPATKWLYSIL